MLKIMIEINATDLEHARKQILELAEKYGSAIAIGAALGVEPSVKTSKPKAEKVKTIEVDPFVEQELVTADVKEEPKFTQSEVVKAFQTFIKSNSAEKAIEILKKLKVKRVTELKPEQFELVMELIK